MPRIIAYRGASWSLPPNTYLAFEAAEAEQADAIGVEVQVTRDGVAVACEDRLLRALGSPYGSVRQATYAELEPIDVGRGFALDSGPISIPRVQDVLSRFGRQLAVFLFLPDSGLAPEDLAAALVAAAPVSHHELWLVSGSTPLLQQLRRVLPAAQSALRLPHPQADAAVLESGEGFEGICVSTRALTPDAVSWARSRNRTVIGFECDTPGAVAHACRLGTDALVTERPAWLRARWSGPVTEPLL